MTERRGGATFSRSTWPRCCTLSPRSISAIVPRVGELRQTCGGKLFDRISGSHHDHTVASFVELLKPQATLSIASGVAAGFRSARRRLGELLDSRLRKFVDIWNLEAGQPHAFFASTQALRCPSSTRLDLSSCLYSSPCHDQVDFAGKLQTSGFRLQSTPDPKHYRHSTSADTQGKRGQFTDRR